MNIEKYDVNALGADNTDKVMLYFSASWCMPCKLLGKVIKGTISDIRVIEIDAGENTGLVEKYLVKSIPTLVLVSGEEIIARRSGSLGPEEFNQFINQ